MRGNLGGDGVVDCRQRGGHTGSSCAGVLRPGAEHHALGGVARSNAHPSCPGGLGLGHLGSDVAGRRVVGARLRGAAVAGDGLLDDADHVGHGGVAKRLHLQRRDLEVVFDAVFNAHAHERIQPEVDQRQLVGQVIGVVAHRLGDDRAQALRHRFTRARVPAHGVDLLDAAQRCCLGGLGDLGHTLRRARARQIERGSEAFDEQRVTAVDGNAGAAEGVRRDRGQLAVRGQDPVLLGGHNARARADLLRHGLDELVRAVDLVGLHRVCHLAVGQCDLGAQQRRAAGQRARGGPQAVALHRRRGCGKKRTRTVEAGEVDGHALDVELGR